MRVPSHAGRSAIGFNMTPMIDVVFQLIVFFLLASHFAKQDVQLELDLPAARSGKTDEADDARFVVVNVLRDGEALLAGRVVTMEELQRVVQLKREEIGEGLEIRIRAHRDAPYKNLEPVMVACARAKTWNVKIAVLREEGG